MLNARKRIKRERMLRLVASERANRAEQWAHDLERKRRASAERARRMIAAERKRTANHRQHAAALSGELARLRRDMADPSQPERASDIAMLKRERDQARTALAAVQQRAERAEAFIAPLSDKVEELAGRVARAEAAARKAA